VVNDANVTLADVVASNGVIHVIDKVLMPPADEPADEPAEPEIVCDATIGITSDGYGFTPASVTIAVGETVCWKWTNESMAHNVKEVAGLKSTTYVENGVYSGAAAKTVDFHHTFTEDTTFYYACEPHIGVEMFGKVIVGDGGAEPAVVAEDKDDKKDNNTPGFLGLTAILATLGAVLVARKRQENEL
ncbi:MAG: plastocyanin/azurin family copper-binding protein, partial [Candidatus Thermoplasmatota archaeon]|nr:plastocyanin/azurin family copper-binding protein [Candidatus Thermoplasmatota archaeon]